MHLNGKRRKIVIQCGANLLRMDKRTENLFMTSAHALGLYTSMKTFKYTRSQVSINRTVGIYNAGGI